MKLQSWLGTRLPKTCENKKKKKEKIKKRCPKKRKNAVLLQARPA